MSRTPSRAVLTLSIFALTLALFVFTHVRLLRVREAEARFGAFVSHLDGAEYERADEEIRAALRLSPGNAHYLSNRALLQERMLGRGFDVSRFREPVLSDAEAARLGTAVELYRQVVAINPDDDGAYHNLGWLYWLARQPERAFECAERAVAIDASVPLYHLSLGLLREYAGRPDVARGEYARALRLSPGILDSKFFRDLRARAPDLAAGLVAETTDYFERQVRETPGAVGKSKLGKLYLYQGSERAGPLLEQATSELPNLSRAWVNLGNFYERRGEEGSMKSCYEKAIFVNGLDFLPWYHLGRYYDRTQQAPEAIGHLGQAVDTWMNQTSIHADRVRRIYRSSFMEKDDVVPHGLNAYAGPEFDAPATCLRLAELCELEGDKALAKHYSELARRFSPPEGGTP